MPMPSEIRGIRYLEEIQLMIEGSESDPDIIDFLHKTASDLRKLMARREHQEIPGQLQMEVR